MSFLLTFLAQKRFKINHSKLKAVYDKQILSNPNPNQRLFVYLSQTHTLTLAKSLIIFRCAHVTLQEVVFIGWSVGWSAMLSLNLWKRAEFTENRCSLRERTTNQGSGSINESRTQSITHSNHSYTSQGASLALFIPKEAD